MLQRASHSILGGKEAYSESFLGVISPFIGMVGTDIRPLSGESEEEGETGCWEGGGKKGK